jgi:PAS domain S-box-containing protein
MLHTPRVIPFILVGLFVFVLDVVSSQNTNVAVLYVPLLLLTTFVPERRFALYATVWVSALTAIAPLFKPDHLILTTEIINRLITGVAIVAAYFAVRVNIFANERNMAVWNQTSTGLLLVNKKGVIIQSSPAIWQIFGYTATELEGLTIESLIPQRFRDKHQHHRNKYNQNQQPRSMGSGLDLYALRKDGTEVPVEVSLSPYSTGTNSYIMVFVVDNTVRKKHLTAMETLNADLENRVKERTYALQETVHELEEQIQFRREAQLQAQKALDKERELNELKSNFVSMASHEFRTPLTSISSSADLIAMYNDRAEPEKIKRHTERIKHSVQNLSSILGDFLSLGKLEEGRIVANIATVHLPNLVDEVREELKYQTKPGQSVIGQHTGEPEFESDGHLLKNILINLVSNAIKYSPEHSDIVITSLIERGKATIQVLDQGIGISKEEQEQLFSKFFRASNVGNEKGTGLGLFIVKNYVDILGGAIACESEPGKGSRFVIEIGF